VFHTEEYGHGRKTYSNGVCVKGSTSSELEVDYYGTILEEVIELQYHSEQNRVFLPFWDSLWKLDCVCIYEWYL